ncbi:hypothetical protein ITI46_05100 [Streptomyces oryzae]|uniref:Uncharacterized protein n=1 Tax=Streptomyces oryzae TaxID=1434886 RepID=A0ABS3X7M0_9ACTN|nr:hypothetical protein [Streptomyces oryzae]MBO8191076.1 hypothetical protein [Streptomyces oryzae]
MPQADITPAETDAAHAMSEAAPTTGQRDGRTAARPAPNTAPEEQP